MSQAVTPTPAQRQAAADWFTRLNDEAAVEGDWLGFTDWLEADLGHRLAYDAVERSWIDLDAAPQAPPAQVIEFKPRPARKLWIWSGAGVAAAAAAAALFVGPALMSPTQVYETAPGQSRTVALADGSKIALAGGSRVEVRFRGKERAASMVKGEADFDIVHDPARPFTVAAGADAIRVLGTQFDVLRRSGGLTVTVERGLVSVTPPSASGDKVLLPAGQQLRRASGLADQVRAVDLAEASAWRSGRLIYRDTPLKDVAEDLSRYGAVPISVEPAIADLKVTAVLKLDDEGAMVDRLQSFLPIRAQATPADIKLRAAGE